MAEMQNQNTQQPTTQQPADNGDKGNERMFTQAEVNQIVSERLRREREKADPQPQNERETALQEREKAVAAQESKYRCREYLTGIHMREQDRAMFLEALDTADFDKFKTTVDILSQPFILKHTVEGTKTENPVCNTGTDWESRISAAFKP